MTGDGGSREVSAGADEGPVSRRRVLAAAVGASAGVASLPDRTGAQGRTGGSATLHVRVYPGPKPLFAWLRTGGYGMRSGWSPVDRDAVRTVREAMEGVAAFARRNSDHDVTATVEARRPVDLGVLSGAPSIFTVPTLSRDVIFESFRALLEQRGELGEACCHLLLWWDPFNYHLGYGGTHGSNAHVGGGPSLSLANLGATEYWDSRPVTRNLAIHETLHTFLSQDVVEDVVDSRCDHDLGRAERIDDAMRVSPMATAYAGDEQIGSGTHWHGTGCYDHDAFWRHDGTDGVDRWEYTTELSDATREAVRRYAERELV